jgi:D-tagatose-1,6-bisphosphate aldolase subunit GatZ/KbaZ
MHNQIEQSHNATRQLLGITRSNRLGEPVGIYSICSTNRFVLETGMLQAARDDTVLCIESTPNQVNQFGGYSGMKPADFARFVQAVAAERGFPAERILLGGDHLGPHVWQNEPAGPAMSNACELVADCIRAGYTKIHLDVSMPCMDDPGDPGSPLDEEKITTRAAELCRVAEDAHAGLPAGSPAPLYIIGTEVPIPGGELAATGRPAVTRIEDVQRTISAARETFLANGLESAWERVIAVVIQPGVEFGDASVVAYDPGIARPLSSYIEKNWHLVCEAHSTDYQSRRSLGQMVQDHFAILKVGPWLTFSFREALFALSRIEREFLSGRKGTTLSCVPEVLEGAMLKHPAYWKSYYRGDEASLHFARKYSYSDRSRYYWPQPEVANALGKLITNLSVHSIPLTLLSQYMPGQYQAVREGRISCEPGVLIRNKILEVIDIYAQACGMR